MRTIQALLLLLLIIPFLAGCRLDDNRLNGSFTSSSSLEFSGAELLYDVKGSGTASDPFHAIAFAGEGSSKMIFSITGSNDNLVCDSAPPWLSVEHNSGQYEFVMEPTASDVGVHNYSCTLENSNKVYEIKVTVKAPSLGFSGNSAPTSPVTDRIFDENDTPAWTLTGACDPELGKVKIGGGAIDSETEVDCQSDGTFSLDINYSTTSPYFTPTFVVDSHEVTIQQGAFPKSRTYLYKTSSSNPPTIVTTAAQLQAMTTNVSNAHYILANDIDLAAEVGTTNNWTPVGTDASRFRGTIDGDNHVIRNMNINAIGTQYVGFFGYAHASMVRNLHFRDADVASNNGNVGIVAGHQRLGNIYQVSATGSVSASGGGVGLIIGYCWSCTVSQSWATGISSGTHSVGGLVGILWGHSVTNSWADVEVAEAASAVQDFGGLVGRLDDSLPDTKIENCYALGNVSGPKAVGSITGGFLSNNSTSIITSAFGFGDVTATDPASASEDGGVASPALGAIARFLSGTLFLNQNNLVLSGVYYNSSLACTDCYTGDPMATAIAPSAFKKKGTYANWDFTGIWSIDEDNGYPQLRANPVTP